MGTLSSFKISYSDEEQDKIDAILAKIGEGEPLSLVQYGIGIQRKIAQFSDRLLHSMRLEECNETGESLQALAKILQECSMDDFHIKKNFLTSLPLIKKIIAPPSHFIAQYTTILATISPIIDQLEASRMNLLGDMILLKKLYTKSEKYYHKVTLYIEVGNFWLTSTKKHLEVKEVDKQLFHSRESMKQEGIVTLEKRLFDLSFSRTLLAQIIAQLATIKKSNELLVNTIQHSILQQVPLWKNGITEAVSHFQKKLSRGYKSSSDPYLALQESHRILVNAIEKALLLQQEERDIYREVQKELTNFDDSFLEPPEG